MQDERPQIVRINEFDDSDKYDGEYYNRLTMFDDQFLIVRSIDHMCSSRYMILKPDLKWVSRTVQSVLQQSTRDKIDNPIKLFYEQHHTFSIDHIYQLSHSVLWMGLPMRLMAMYDVFKEYIFQVRISTKLACNYEQFLKIDIARLRVLLTELKKVSDKKIKFTDHFEYLTHYDKDVPYIETYVRGLIQGCPLQGCPLMEMFEGIDITESQGYWAKNILHQQAIWDG